MDDAAAHCCVLRHCVLSRVCQPLLVFVRHLFGLFYLLLAVAAVEEDLLADRGPAEATPRGRHLASYFYLCPLELIEAQVDHVEVVEVPHVRDCVVEASKHEQPVLADRHSMPRACCGSAADVELLPRKVGRIEPPEVSIVVKLRLSRRGELAAKDVHEGFVRRNGVRTSWRRLVLAAVPRPHVLVQTVPEEVRKEVCLVAVELLTPVDDDVRVSSRTRTDDEVHPRRRRTGVRVLLDRKLRHLLGDDLLKELLDILLAALRLGLLGALRLLLCRLLQRLCLA
mmetsp:Transcript_12328/g.37592  ORF Transcript_12328/g.37592 Transcript_12328/m.37592 type:complete len:283 (+) Transcript_12328:2235-3083(+)